MSEAEFDWKKHVAAVGGLVGWQGGRRGHTPLVAVGADDDVHLLRLCFGPRLCIGDDGGAEALELFCARGGGEGIGLCLIAVHSRMEEVGFFRDRAGGVVLGLFGNRSRSVVLGIFRDRGGDEDLRLCLVAVHSRAEGDYWGGGDFEHIKPRSGSEALGFLRSRGGVGVLELFVAHSRDEHVGMPGSYDGSAVLGLSRDYSGSVVLGLFRNLGEDNILEVFCVRGGGISGDAEEV